MAKSIPLPKLTPEDRDRYLAATAKAILSIQTGKTYGISSPSKKGELSNDISNR